MKVLITSQGKDLSSPVDPRFGRAMCFLVVDTESGELKPVDNTQNLNAPQGAGIQAAENASRQGVDAVLTGHCGPKAFATLRAAGIKIYTGAEGTVAETLQMFKAGKLIEAGNADVEGHWM